jgi:hypothetical protein
MCVADRGPRLRLLPRRLLCPPTLRRRRRRALLRILLRHRTIRRRSLRRRTLRRRTLRRRCGRLGLGLGRLSALSCRPPVEREGKERWGGRGGGGG